MEIKRPQLREDVGANRSFQRVLTIGITPSDTRHYPEFLDAVLLELDSPLRMDYGGAPDTVYTSVGPIGKYRETD